MLCIAMVTRKRVTKCSECGKVLDLRNGGLFFHDAKCDGMQPVCGDCVSKQNAPLALCGALYGHAARDFNEQNPDKAVSLALLDHLSGIEDAAVDKMIEAAEA